MAAGSGGRGACGVAVPELPGPPAPAAASFPVRRGNRVLALVDGVEAFGRIREAVEAAEHSVWTTVAFASAEFRFPGSNLSPFDLLDAAAGRGVDVRVVFWRTNPETDHLRPDTFWGDPAHHGHLDSRGSGWSARWARAPGGACHHQKSWVIDAGTPAEIAFVGGMNLNPSTVCDHRHDRDYTQHDVYSEIIGPAVQDVAANFVERWNLASDRAADGGARGPHGPHDLDRAAGASPAVGDTAVQIQRSMPGANGHTGETSILEQYLLAIDTAERSIVIQNQSMLCGQVLARLLAAVQRGAHVSMTLPFRAENQVRARRDDPALASLFEDFTRLVEHPNASVLGLVPPVAGGRIHVHAKVMVVDDHWLTIGSCNMRDRSFREYSEMNASIWDASLARSLRIRLFDELTGRSTFDLDLMDAHLAVADVALANRSARAAGTPLTGLAVALDPHTYGREDP